MVRIISKLILLLCKLKKHCLTCWHHWISQLSWSRIFIVLWTKVQVECSNIVMVCATHIRTHNNQNGLFLADTLDQLPKHVGHSPQNPVASHRWDKDPGSLLQCLTPTSKILHATSGISATTQSKNMSLRAQLFTSVNSSITCQSAYCVPYVGCQGRVAVLATSSAPVRQSTSRS